MPEKHDNKLVEVEYHSNGRLCTTAGHGLECEHYESSGNMASGRYHTCGSCKHWGIVGSGCEGNACFNDKNNRPE